MHVGALVHARNLDLARLELLDRLGDVERHCAALGVRHQPAWTRGRGRACRPRPSCPAWRRWRRCPASPAGSSGRSPRRRRNPLRPPRPPSLVALASARAPAGSCRCRAAGRRCLGPAGPSAGGPHPRWDETTMVSSNSACAVWLDEPHGLGQVPDLPRLLCDVRRGAIALCRARFMDPPCGAVAWRTLRHSHAVLHDVRVTRTGPCRPGRGPDSDRLRVPRGPAARTQV